MIKCYWTIYAHVTEDSQITPDDPTITGHSFYTIHEDSVRDRLPTNAAMLDHVVRNRSHFGINYYDTPPMWMISGVAIPVNNFKRLTVKLSAIDYTTKADEIADAFDPLMYPRFFDWRQGEPTL